MRFWSSKYTFLGNITKGNSIRGQFLSFFELKVIYLMTMHFFVKFDVYFNAISKISTFTSHSKCCHFLLDWDIDLLFSGFVQEFYVVLSPIKHFRIVKPHFFTNGDPIAHCALLPLVLKGNCTAWFLLIDRKYSWKYDEQKKTEVKSFCRSPEIKYSIFLLWRHFGQKAISPIHLPFKGQSLKFNYFRFPESFCIKIGSKVLCFVRKWVQVSKFQNS